MRSLFTHVTGLALTVTFCSACTIEIESLIGPSIPVATVQLPELSLSATIKQGIPMPLADVDAPPLGFTKDDRFPHCIILTEPVEVGVMKVTTPGPDRAPSPIGQALITRDVDLSGVVSDL